MGEFVRGEVVEVSDDLDRWVHRIYLATVEGSRFPIICVGSSSEEEERFRAGEEYRRSSFKYVRKANPPFRVDDPVWVRRDYPEDSAWEKRHFARWGIDGKIMCFIDGKTSWSARAQDVLPWDRYKKPLVLPGV
jgi:hypothetical protein